MRAQVNNGILKEYPDNAIISLGSCTGDNTYEIVCELTENFENEFWMFEGEVVNDEIVKLNRIQ